MSFSLKSQGTLVEVNWLSPTAVPERMAVSIDLTEPLKVSSPEVTTTLHTHHSALKGKKRKAKQQLYMTTSDVTRKYMSNITF